MAQALKSDSYDGSDAPAVLGVEESVLGKRWRPRLGDERTALGIAQRLDVPEIVGRIMAGRGVSMDDAERYLDPTLKTLLPDPSVMRDMDAAAARIAKAIHDSEPVAVFGDYDVDGATSSAVLHRYFAAIGVPLRIYIPDRLKEGYGPNAPALEALAKEGIKVALTVDCGITAFEALEAAADAGLDMIVVDHHVAEPKLPRAAAVVNPNRMDDDSGLGHLAAVGVAYMLVIALNRKLRADGWFADRTEPNLVQWLDLVALGTVCDVVPLTGLNRAFVTQGLKVMARRQNTGLRALADVARLNEAPGAFHLGFLLGPRVNAGGRVGEAGLGARLLTTEDAVEAQRLAEQLDRYNTERKEIEAAVLDAALAQVGEDFEGPAVIAVGEGWHPGVIGIVASRLVGKYGRPAFVIGTDGDVGKGSARSIQGIDLGAAVIAARQSGLLINGGGHKMAAGLTVETAKIDALRKFLTERLWDEGAADIKPSLGVDGTLSVSGATPDLFEMIAQAGPYGAGNPEPRFVLADARVAFADVVGESHVRVSLSEIGGKPLKGIAFRATESGLGEMLLKNAGKGHIHIAGHLRADTWQGRKGVQFVIEDAAAV